MKMFIRKSLISLAAVLATVAPSFAGNSIDNVTYNLSGTTLTLTADILVNGSEMITSGLYVTPPGVGTDIGGLTINSLTNLAGYTGTTTGVTIASFEVTNPTLYGAILGFTTNGPGFANKASFSFSQASVTTVPEPGVVAFGMIAAGSVLGLVARKRKG
jgi:hypothetical protein